MIPEIKPLIKEEAKDPVSKYEDVVFDRNDSSDDNITIDDKLSDVDTIAYDNMSETETIIPDNLSKAETEFSATCQKQKQ